MSEALKTELVNFSELTGEAGSARRAELARHVATLFALTSDRCSDEQVDIYDSVLIRLVDMVEQEVRQYVAEQMAGLRRGPEETIRKLAEDSIEVAEPLLKRSTVLRDADLIRIASNTGNAHRFAIAHRDVISEEVSDVLVRRGDLRVKRKVASNTGANLSDASMMTLVGDAAADATLQMSLSDRGDLAEKHIKALVAVASEEVRKKLYAKGRRSEAARLDEAQEIAEQRMSNQYWLGRYDFETARSRVLLLAKRGMVSEATLRRFASEDRFPEAVAAFAWLVRCGVEEVSHWMVRAEPEPFLIIAKASGLSAITVGALLSIGPWRHRLSPEVRTESMKTFERMTVADAKRKMAHWSNVVLN
ncbi:uncharacterized protein (DUF2336 family) [Roseibium hamelinense]|uniref:Uncharacterized protein (DUF2336 family) n=1 Tax=Roseibium hamelinense TaxID=150831 RepID=A0A562TBH4_9HYPH|nr:DUF2336 domain-containing protein [Roseibium hamelinense]MTI45476.1 DUF2336 domain-containing protein [Roseibium hamelinense]TWI90150.1 uncharacterized protein (DUF2336 family) [Roseibium hamelinense]